jgi:PEP-CTERM motif
MKKLLLAAAALSMATPTYAASNFFTNWDSTDFGAGPGFTILPSYEGWTRVAGGGIEVQFNNVAGLPFSGENLVELDSNSNSTMERLIDAGNYTLSFYFSPRPNRAANTNGIDVLVNGSSVFAITGVGGPQTVWTQHFVNFSVGAPSTLRFSATGISDSLGGYLEDIRLTAVPEPATWAMMLAGFGLIGFSARRRKSVRVSFA